MSELTNDQPAPAGSPACQARREALKAALGGVAAMVIGDGADASPKVDSHKLPPQIGDQLAYPTSDYADRLVLASELETNAAPLLVYPRDPKSGKPRERSRLNQILLFRADPAKLDAATSKLAAAGIVAYSAICTHAACGVSEWDETKLQIICPCHASAFNPHARAKVVNGPATRALPALPLKLVDNRLIVAGLFTAPVGANPV